MPKKFLITEKFSKSRKSEGVSLPGTLGTEKLPVLTKKSFGELGDEKSDALHLKV